MKDYKILFADLDGTLITTASGKTFAEDCTDFRIRKDVLDKIRWMPELEYVFVVTNQGGIPEYITETEFTAKFHAILYFMKRYLSYKVSKDGLCSLPKYIAGTFCASMDKDDNDRKPNTGMLTKMLSLDIVGSWKFEKSDMLMIGDASGKEGQFSDSDRRCAENFGIGYMDVEDFLKA